MEKFKFYKLSFWIDGIILDSKAHCYFKADSETDALNQLFTKHGHFKLFGLSISVVSHSSKIYKTLCSIYQ